MKSIKTLCQLLEWMALYFWLSLFERGLVARPFWRRQAQTAPRLASLPVLEHGLMLVIVGCVAFVTSCVLWFVSQGWGEALYAIPFFIVSVFVALLYPGLRARRKRGPGRR